MTEEKKSEEVTKKIKVMLVVTNHNKLGDTKKQTGFYIPEVAHPYYFFKNHGYDVVFTSIKGGLAEVDEGSVKSFSSDVTCRKFFKEFLERNQEKFLETYAVSALDASKFQVVFYSGGHGTMWDFPNDTIMNKAAEKVYANGGIISAVCHGPSGLLNLKNERGEHLINGKNVTGFSNSEEEAVGLTKVVPFALETELKGKKANYSCGENFKTHVISDSRIVTGQNPASSLECARSVVKEVNKTFGKEYPTVSVLVVVTNHTDVGSTKTKTGWNLAELAHPYYQFVESGYKVTIASPKGGLAAVDPNSATLLADDVECSGFLANQCDKDRKVDTVAVSALNHKNYHVLFLVGGHGCLWDFPNEETLRNAAKAIYENGGIVAAISHGQAAIFNLVENKNVTGISDKEEEETKIKSDLPFSIEEKLKKVAKYSKASKPWEPYVVVADKIITGQNYRSGHKIGEAVINAVNQHVFK